MPMQALMIKRLVPSIKHYKQVFCHQEHMHVMVQECISSTKLSKPIVSSTNYYLLGLQGKLVPPLHPFLH